MALKCFFLMKVVMLNLLKLPPAIKTCVFKFFAHVTKGACPFKSPDVSIIQLRHTRVDMCFLLS